MNEVNVTGALHSPNPNRYDLTKAKWYCEYLGLVWFGDEYVAAVVRDAELHGFNQAQFDIAMWHCLWHVRTLFTPKSYKWWGRILLAGHFLFGGMKPLKGVRPN